MKKILAFIMCLACGIAIAAPVKSMMGMKNLMSNADDGADLPYDALVQYIGTKNPNSENMPYLDTGIVLIEEFGIIHNFVITYTATSPGAWGFYTYGFGNCPWVGVYPRGNQRVVFGNSSKSYDWHAATGWSTYKYDSQTGWYVNGVQVIESNVTLLTSDSRRTGVGKTLPLFICYDLRYGMQYTKSPTHNMSQCSIYLEGELILDLYPCRITNEDGNREGAMYDAVSGEIFRNAGTGSFEIGPDL